jgi:hypothetical protein
MIDAGSTPTESWRMELPSSDVLPGIVERCARLLSSIGHDLGKRPLVLPTAEFFPDRFVGDAESAAALVARMAGHAGLSDVPLSTRVITQLGEPEDEHEASRGGCTSGCVPAGVAGSSPRLVDDGDGWTLNVPANELSHSVVVTTMIARALGHVFLVETLAPHERIEAPADLTADYAAVALGFGPLLMEGAYIYSKGCGGPQVAQVTRASLPELAIVSALFAEMGSHSTRKALRELGATQSAVFGDALEWAKTNSELVTRLREEPARVAGFDYTLSESKPWLLRVFGGKKSAGPDSSRSDSSPPSGQRTRSTPPKASDPHRDEIRALVEEALAK